MVNYAAAIADGYVPSPEMIAAILNLDLGGLGALDTLFQQLHTSLAPEIVSDGQEADGDTSAAGFTIAENTTAVTTVQVIDPQNDAVTYTLSGADAALFTIDAAGNLAFIDAPDFENPQDANGDNVYEVVVHASDGSLEDTQSIQVEVSDVDELPNIVHMLAEDGDQTFYATEGVDYFIYDMDGTSSQVNVLDIDTFTIVGFDPTEDRLIFINAEASNPYGWFEERGNLETDFHYYDRNGYRTRYDHYEQIYTSGNTLVVNDTTRVNINYVLSRDYINLQTDLGEAITLDAFEYMSSSADPNDATSSILIYEDDPFALI